MLNSIKKTKQVCEIPMQSGKTKFYFSFITILLIAIVMIGSLKTFGDSWVRKADFGGAYRSEATGFAIGTKGYIGTGYGAGIYNDFWEYDSGNNTWTQKADFSGGARRGATGFAIGTKGYVGTGCNNNGSIYYNDFWEYDSGNNTWTQKANFGGIARHWAIGFTIGSKGYIGTGVSSNDFYDFWEYDQANNLWTQKANFGGTGRYAATGFTIGNKGYVGTGWNSGIYFNDFWEYDQGSNTWAQKANFGGSGRYKATGFAIGTKGYIGTGDDFNLINDFWEYDQANNLWTQKANFGGSARIYATGFAIGTNGYIGTGYGGPGNDFWEYTPDSIPTGIEELNNANAINIYPNPLTSSSILQLSAKIKDAEVVIYNMEGKEIWSQSLRGGSATKQSPTMIEIGSLLETRKLESGVYFVAVKSEESQWVEKMVVK